MAAGNDSTKATYCSAMRALLEDPEQRQKLLDDPSLVPSAVEEALRMFPAFAHFRRTATRDTELNGAADQRGRQGGHVVRRPRTATRRATRTRTASTSRATPSTRRSAPAGGTSASAPRSRGSSCGSCSRRRSRATREMELDGAPAVRRVAVRQPAEDAAGPAGLLAPGRPSREGFRVQAKSRVRMYFRLGTSNGIDRACAAPQAGSHASHLARRRARRTRRCGRVRARVRGDGRARREPA